MPLFFIHYYIDMDNHEHADLLQMAEALDSHTNPCVASAPKKYTFCSLKVKDTELDIAVWGETIFHSSSTASANEPQQGKSVKVNRGQM